MKLIVFLTHEVTREFLYQLFVLDVFRSQSFVLFQIDDTRKPWISKGRLTEEHLRYIVMQLCIGNFLVFKTYEAWHLVLPGMASWCLWRIAVGLVGVLFEFRRR